MPAEIESDAFRYPPAPHIRRHGPHGYADIRSYHPWLRVEFTFRCVYCLIRERWGRVSGDFDLDHFVPQTRLPRRSTEYGNLLYACHTCKLRKGAKELPDASLVFTADTVRIYPDGTMAGMTAEARRLIRVLCLNSRQMVRWRRIWIRNVELARQHDPDQYRQLMGFPNDLPDLSACRPPTNTKRQGVTQSYFARRERGELEATYLS